MFFEVLKLNEVLTIDYINFADIKEQHYIDVSHFK
jgi:hypothetical protein